MNGHQRLRENCPDGSGAGLHQLADVPPGGFPAETAVGLIAQLHHAYVHPGVLQLPKAVRGVAVQGIGLFVDFHTDPRFGNHLLTGIGPEIGIVKIDQKLHAVPGGSLADGEGGADVAVSAAVAPAGAVVRIHPNPNPDVVDPVFGKDLKNVLLLTVKIIVPDAARLQRRHDGGVHAQNKGFGHALNPRNIQRVRSDDPLLPAASGQTPGQQADGQPCKHPFHGSYLPCISRRKPLPDCAFIFRIGRCLPVRGSGILPPVPAESSHGSVRRWCR